MSERRRPIGVMIVGILFFLAGLVFIAGWGSRLGKRRFDGDGRWRGLSDHRDSLHAIGVRLLQGMGLGLDPWRWCSPSSASLVTLWGAFSNGFDMDALWAGLIGIIIPLIILLYLFSHKVKVWFGKA